MNSQNTSGTKQIKKVEFSKKIFIVTFITAVVATVCAVWLILLGFDISSYTPIVLALWTAVATQSGFYYIKAKAENLIKLASETTDEVVNRAVVIDTMDDKSN